MADPQVPADANGDQTEFCSWWLERRGVFGRPTFQQLVEMAEAYAAHRLMRARAAQRRAAEAANRPQPSAP